MAELGLVYNYTMLMSKNYSQMQEYTHIALHGMQTRYSDENSVCLSDCPSVKRVDCDKTKEKLRVQIFFYRTKGHLA